MVTSVKEQPLKKRPTYRNIHITQLASYRLPPAGWASILHRVSGAVNFLLLPFAIWLFDASLTSEVSYGRFTSVFDFGAGVFPGWFFKFIAFALICSFCLHFCGGVRHLWMDATHDVGKKFGRLSAQIVFVVSAVLSLALGAKLFGLY